MCRLHGIYRPPKKYFLAFHFHFITCGMGVIFKMMFFSCLLVLLGSIFVQGKRHSLECWYKKTSLEVLLIEFKNDSSQFKKKRGW